MDSTGTAFHPLIQQEWNFLNLSRIDKCSFPSESIRFQWIRWTPSERLSTLSSNMGGIFLSLPRIENELFHWNLYVSSGSDGLHRNDFPPPHPTWAEFFYVSHEQKMNFSIGIYSFPMDQMDSIGTTFHPFIQHEWNYCKSLTNRKLTFPSESIRVQWIQYTW